MCLTIYIVGTKYGVVIPLRLVTSEIIVLTDSSSFHALRTQNAGEMRRWVFFTTAVPLIF